MKKFVLITMCIFMVVLCSCSNNTTNSNFEKIVFDNKAKLTSTISYNQAEAFFDDTILVKVGNYIGVVDNKGRERIPAEYLGLMPLSSDLFLFSKNAGYNKNGLMDGDGNVICNDEYNRFYYLNDNYVFINKAKDIDSDGVVQEFELYLFSLKDKKIMNEFNFIDVKDVQDVSIVENCLRFTAVIEENGKMTSDVYFYDINTAEEMFDEVIYFNNDESYYFKATKNGCTGIYDVNGNFISDEYSILYDIRLPMGKEKLIPVINVPANPENSNTKIFTGYINTDGTLAIACEYDYPHVYPKYFLNNNFVAVRKNGYWGFIDKNGNKLTEFMYDSVEQHKSGYYIVEMNDLYGFVGKDCQFTTPVELERKGGTSTDILEHNREASFVDESGEYTINPWSGKRSESYDDLFSLGDSLFVCTDENGKGLLSYENKIIECKYKNCEVSKDKKVVLCSNGNSYDIYTLQN